MKEATGDWSDATDDTPTKEITMTEGEMLKTLLKVRMMSESQLAELALIAISRDPTLINESFSDKSGITFEQYGRVKQHCVDREKVSAIKLYRNITGRTLKESKDWVEETFAEQLSRTELDEFGSGIEDRLSE